MRKKGIIFGISDNMSSNGSVLIKEEEQFNEQDQGAENSEYDRHYSHYHFPGVPDVPKVLDLNDKCILARSVGVSLCEIWALDLS